MWLELNRRFGALAIGAVLAGSAAVPLHGQDQSRGVVVEAVATAAAGETAGVQPGDVLRSWVRAAAPPANPEEARGEIGSPFDFADIEMEQAPRGDVTLSGTRDGKSFAVRVPLGAWEITVRPQLVAPQLSAYEEGKRLIAAKEIDRGIAAWRELAAQSSNANDPVLAAWLFLRVGDTLGAARNFDEAHAAYRTALEAIKAHRDQPIIPARIWDADAAAFERQNDFRNADAGYRLALQIREKNPQETLALARSLTSVGNAARSRGDLTAAHELFKRALAIRERLAPKSLDVAASLNNLGIAAGSRGDLAAAEEFFRRSLAIREALAPDIPEIADNLNNLGIVVVNRGDLAGAQELLWAFARHGGETRS